MIAATSIPLTGAAAVFALLFGLILVLPRLFESLRLPGLIGLIAGGVLVGPTGLGLLEREGMVAMLGGGGLLYLMFEAGLELDLEELRLHRRGALTFGALTFALPFIVGTAVHLWLGYSMLAAMLLGSCWSSHTLLAYPVFQRARVVTNRAVAIGVGGTIITDTAALLLLVVLAGAHGGNLTVGFALQLLPGIIGAGIVILVVLPRVADWFFAGIGQERSVRFLFVVVALYASSELAELAGVEAIIGAFMAGLALNRRITEGSPLAGELQFFGSRFMVPLFLISVGMLVDPTVIFADPDTLLRAAGFSAAVIIGKLSAAGLTGALFGYHRYEIASLFSLSIAQAAATLAAVFVGIEIGLLEEDTVNAVIIVILISTVLASLVANNAAPRLPAPTAKVGKLGTTVLLPLEDPESGASVVPLAAMLAAADAGTVIPLTVLDLEASSSDVRVVRDHLTERVDRLVMANGAEARSLVRLDLTPGAGVLHAAVEEQATCVFMGWRGATGRRGAVFGDKIDAVATASPVPVIMCRTGGDDRPERVVLAVDEGDLEPGAAPGLALAAAVAERLAQRTRLPLVMVRSVTDEPDVNVIDLPEFAQAHVDPTRSLVAVLQDRTMPGDIIVKGLAAFGRGPSAQVAIHRLTRRLGGRTILVTSSRAEVVSRAVPTGLTGLTTART